MLSKNSDFDALNYVEEEESEATTFDDVEEGVYDYSYKDVIFDFLCSKRVIFSILATIHLLLALLLWNSYLTIVEDKNVESQISSGVLSLLCGVSIFFFITIEYFIESFSLYRLKRTHGAGAFWYYTNELSSYISFLIIFILLSGYLHWFLNLSNSYIKNPFSLQLYIYDAFRIIFFTTLCLAAQEALVKHVSMGFNYNHYVNRIRKCLLFDFFISLISHLNEAESDVVIETGGDDGPILLVDSSGTDMLPNTLVFQKKFRTKNLEKLGFGVKRLLIKEFLHLTRNTVSHTGNLPLILGKIRALAVKKATKLVRKLVRRGKVTQMGDFVRYFNNPETFEYLMSQLELGMEEKVEKENFVRIIERAYRERYLIYNSIEQVTAAINKVAFFLRMVTYALAAISLYISSIHVPSTMQPTSVLFGTISAIFGSQFINKVISDEIVKSLLFLFVVHPFDIGDRILVKLNGEAENLVVAELHVFSTLFYRWDGTSVFVPNYILASTSISNIRRSGPTMESHSIQVNSSTDPTKLITLKHRLLEFCRAHSEDYTDYIMVNYEKIENVQKLHIKVLMQYQSNWQNYEMYLKKKTKFLLELNRILEDLDITYDQPLQKITLNTKGLLDRDALDGGRIGYSNAR